jgi:copper transport protein
VTWRVVASDTHPASGRFTFSVGEPSAVAGLTDSGPTVGPLALEALGRWLHFAGYVLGFGVPAFIALVLLPIGAGQASALARLRGLMEAGFVLLLVAAVIAVFAQAASLSAGLDAADAESVLTDALASSFGFVVGEQLTLAVLLWVVLGAAPALAGQPLWLLLGLGAALALVDGEAAHAISVRPTWLGLAVNTVHVGAMGTWLGGLLSLLAIWRVPDVAGTRRRLVTRFSRVAVWSLLLLLASGAIMSVQHLSAVGDLLAPGYGQALGAKLALVGVVLALALGGLRAEGAQWQRWWGAEAAVLAGVLALAGVLTSLPPPR